VKGYQITFSIQRNRYHQGMLLADWLVQLADELRLGNVTRIPANEELDHDHQPGTVSSVEVAGQPICVVMIVTEEEVDQLFGRLRAEEIQIYYDKVLVHSEESKKRKGPHLTLVR
jgi:hypothetical protein